MPLGSYDVYRSSGALIYVQWHAPSFAQYRKIVPVKKVVLIRKMVQELHQSDFFIKRSYFMLKFFHELNSTVPFRRPC